MSSRTPDLSQPDLGRSGEVSDAEDFRRMAPIYAGVVIVQVMVLLGLWWFQTYFG